MMRRAKQLTLSAAVPAIMLASAASAEAPDVAPDNPLINHPQPNAISPDGPPPNWTLEVVNDGTKSIYQTALSIFEQSKPFQTSNPSNLLPNVYTNMYDSGGDEIPNSLPSTPEDPYNLHPDPEVSDINGISPRMDLERIINELETSVFVSHRKKTNREFFEGGQGVPADPRRGGRERTGDDAGTIEEEATAEVDAEDVQMGIDILEGNPLEDRVYSGMALLNYNGPNKVKQVDDETNTVTVHQMWMRSRIKGDTMFIDPSNVMNETWTIRYVIDVSHWGHEDFAPFGVFWDDPQDNGGKRIPFFNFDQTFFPMEKNKRYVFEISMPPGRYWNLTYHWGWRVHAPRIQAIENATKKIMGTPIVQFETDVFGDDPRASEQAKLEAISMISDLAPAKRMWRGFRGLKSLLPLDTNERGKARSYVNEIRAAFEDWKHRTSLPRGVEFAEGYDQTLFYANSQIYGEIEGQNFPENVNKTWMGEQQPQWPEWQTRGATLETKLLNGDYFPHLYQNVDFGGRRGWENTYQNTLPIGGQGPWFTFGRIHFLPNTKRPAIVPAGNRDAQLAALDVPDGLKRKGVDGIKRAPTVPAVPKIAQRQRSAKAMAKVPGRIDHLKHSGARIKAAQTSDGIGWHEAEITFRYDPARRLRMYQFDPSHHNTDIFSVH